MIKQWPRERFGDFYAEPARNGVTKPKSERGFGVRMVNMGELFAFPRLHSVKMARVHLTDSEQKKFLLTTGDLLFARRSLVLAGAGKCAIVMEISEPTTFESSIIRVRLDPAKADPLFWFYYFVSRAGRADVEAIVTQLNISGIRSSELSEILVCAPPLYVQRRIAGILSAYDDLIEVNTRWIAALEELARRLFDEWFVKFRFPGQKQLGTMPGDWKRCAVGDVLETLESGSRPKGGAGGEGDIPSIGAENVIGLGSYVYGKEKLISKEFFSSMRRGHVRHGDVMLYKDGAYIGRLSMAWAGFPHEECAVNEHVFLLRPKKIIPPQFLFFWLNQADLQAKIRGLNANAAQPGLNQPGVKGLPIIIPSALLLERFDATTRPVFDLLFTLARQNPILRAARDLLLPKLISGEIDLERAERNVETEAKQVAAE